MTSSSSSSTSRMNDMSQCSVCDVWSVMQISRRRREMLVSHLSLALSKSLSEGRPSAFQVNWLKRLFSICSKGSWAQFTVQQVMDTKGLWISPKQTWPYEGENFFSENFFYVAINQWYQCNSELIMCMTLYPWPTVRGHNNVRSLSMQVMETFNCIVQYYILD